jgi:hypothetical protein
MRQRPPLECSRRRRVPEYAVHGTGRGCAARVNERRGRRHTMPGRARRGTAGGWCTRVEPVVVVARDLASTLHTGMRTGRHWMSRAGVVTVPMQQWLQAVLSQFMTTTSPAAEVSWMRRDGGGFGVEAFRIEGFKKRFRFRACHLLLRQCKDRHGHMQVL